MLGGVYAMFAIGLALIFGVMKLVNIAHGDLIVLSAYVALIVTNSLQINPLVSLVFVIPIMAIVGYLLQRRALPVSALSGGQQQMVAIGRALMSNPKLLLCDELSLGLAPIVVRDIYTQLREIVASGVSAIVVEQDITQALKIADRVYCMLEGRVVLQGGAGELTRAAIAAAYFGV